MRKTLVIAGFLALAWTAPGARAQATPSPDAPIRGAGDGGQAFPQWHGMWGGDREYYAVAIRDARQWDKLWGRLGKRAPSPFTPSSSLAVYIAIGRRPTGGYGAEVVSAEVHDKKLVVKYREYSPPPDALVQEAISHPWVVAILPRSDLAVIFKRTEGSRTRSLPATP